MIGNELYIFSSFVITIDTMVRINEKGPEAELERYLYDLVLLKNKYSSFYI